MAGPATIGSLRVELGLNSAQFTSGLKRSKAEASGFAGAMKSAMGEVRASIEGAAGNAGILGTALGGAGLVGVAAAAALVSAFGEAKKAMAFGDELGDSAAKLAVTTDALQQYRYAVHALGGEYADADTALAGFSKAFGAAHAQLSARAAKPFLALGLDPKQFASTEEALQAVIRRISELKSTAEQAAIADKLGLTPMLPALRAGADKINELRGAAQDLGYVMDAALIEKAGEANDKFEDLQSIMDVQFKSTMVELAPTVLSVADALNTTAKSAGDLMTMLQDLNTWSASKDLGAMFRWSNEGGKALGAKLGTDKFGQIGPSIFRAMGGGKGGSAPAVAPKAPPPPPSPPAGDRDLIGAPPKAPTGGGKGVSASQRTAASEQAIASATRAELSARIALTRDVATVAALREQEVQAEVENANSRLQKDAAEGRITKAAAATAIALNNRAAVEKTALIRREAEVALQDQAISQQEASVRAANQIAQIEASLAATATERNAFEAGALERQQSVERIRLQADLDRDLAAGKITEIYRATALAQEKELQAAERRAAAREAQVRVEVEAGARAEAGLRLQIDLLASQADAATTTYERHRIALEILKLEQQLERLKLEEIVATTKAGSVEHDAAKARLGSLAAIHANQTKAATGWGLLADAFGDAADAVDDVVDAFRNQDWVGVLKGAIDAFKSIRAAVSSGGLAGGIGAAAGAVAPYVGGVGGSTLSGVAAGAQLGSMLLPGIGTAIGAALGGIAGFLGGSSAKKKAKREAAEKARLAEEERKAKVAAEKRGLELTLMEAQGKTAEVLAARRADELAVMDASNRALQEQVWAAQDAAELASQTRELELSLMEAQGNASGVLAARRAAELAAMDAALRPLQEAIYAAQDLGATTAKAAGLVEDARNNLARAYEREAAGLTSTIDKFKGFATSLRGVRDSLSDDLLDAADPQAALDAAEADFRRVAALAQLGNEDAMNDLGDVIESYRKASLDFAPDALSHLKNLGAMLNAAQAAEETATRTASNAELQLSALDASVSGLLAINDSVMGVSDAIGELSKVLGGYSKASGQKLGLNPSSNAALAAATGYKGDFGAGGWQAWIVQQDDTTKAAARQILTAFGQPERIVGFKTGGSFEVGGSGGADSQIMQLAATPGEMINITRPGQSEDVANAVRQLRADLVPAVLAVAGSNSRIEAHFQRAEIEGWGVRGEEPGSPVLTKVV